MSLSLFNYIKGQPKSKKWFFAAIALITLVASWRLFFTTSPKKFQDRYFAEVEKKFGFGDTAVINAGGSATLLNNSVSITATPDTQQNECHLKIQYLGNSSKPTQEDNVSYDKAHHFSLRTSTVDAQYFAIVRKINSKELFMLVLLERDYTTDALEKNAPLFETRHPLIKIEIIDRAIYFIMSFLATIPTGIAGNYAYDLIRDYCKKRRLRAIAQRGRRPPNKKSR